MNNPEMHDVVTALRRRARHNESGPDVAPEPSKALVKNVEKTLFLRGGIGPVASILERACRDLDATVDWSSMHDGDLLKLWAECVEKLSLDFSRSPESWLDSDSEEFFRRSAVVFGVEDNRIHELVRTFHGRPKDERVAIFLPLRRSPLFAYIDREISEMIEDVEIADPDESFRSLIRSVHSKA